MTYTTEFASLKAKLQVVEHILIQIDSLYEQIASYREQEHTDSWYKEQVTNLEKEISAYEALMKQISK